MVDLWMELNLDVSLLYIFKFSMLLFCTVEVVVVGGEVCLEVSLLPPPPANLPNNPLPPLWVAEGGVSGTCGGGGEATI